MTEELRSLLEFLASFDGPLTYVDGLIELSELIKELAKIKESVYVPDRSFRMFDGLYCESVVETFYRLISRVFPVLSACFELEPEDPVPFVTDPELIKQCLVALNESFDSLTKLIEIISLSLEMSRLSRSESLKKGEQLEICAILIGSNIENMESLTLSRIVKSLDAIEEAGKNPGYSDDLRKLFESITLLHTPLHKASSYDDRAHTTNVARDAVNYEDRISDDGGIPKIELLQKACTEFLTALSIVRTNKLRATNS